MNSDDGDLDDVDLLRVDAVHFPRRSSVLQGLAALHSVAIPQASPLNPKHEKTFYKLCWLRKLARMSQEVSKVGYSVIPFISRL